MRALDTHPATRTRPLRQGDLLEDMRDYTFIDGVSEKEEGVPLQGVGTPPFSPLLYFRWRCQLKVRILIKKIEGGGGGNGVSVLVPVTLSLWLLCLRASVGAAFVCV